MQERFYELIDFLKRLKRLRLKSQFRKPLKRIGFGILILIFALGVFPPMANYYYRLKQPASYGKIKIDCYKDLNPAHLKYAKKNGIKPFKKNQEFKSKVNELVDQGILVKITNARNYQVEKLTYSHAYLTPIANDFLNDLGKRFQKKLNENKMGIYAFQISSLFRTEENQRGLSKSNSNASPNSSHLYATTFDIAYDSVIKKPLPWMKIQMADPKAIKLLSEAIGELRNDGRCLVVTEKQEKCFHITVVK